MALYSHFLCRCTLITVGIHKDFCLNLQRLRKAKGFTQESLAEALDVHLTWVQSLEYGYKSSLKKKSKTRKRVRKNWPSPETIKKLAIALKCKENDFFVPT